MRVFIIKSIKIVLNPSNWKRKYYFLQLIIPIYSSFIAAIEITKAVDRWVPWHSDQTTPVIYSAAHAGGGWKNVRKVNGICAGVYQAVVRSPRTSGVQSHSDLPGRGLQFSGAFYGERDFRLNNFRSSLFDLSAVSSHVSELVCLDARHSIFCVRWSSSITPLSQLWPASFLSPGRSMGILMSFFFSLATEWLAGWLIGISLVGIPVINCIDVIHSAWTDQLTQRSSCRFYILLITWCLKN